MPPNPDDKTLPRPPAPAKTAPDDAAPAKSPGKAEPTATAAQNAFPMSRPPTSHKQPRLTRPQATPGRQPRRASAQPCCSRRYSPALRRRSPAPMRTTLPSRTAHAPRRQRAPSGASWPRRPRVPNAGQRTRRHHVRRHAPPSPPSNGSASRAPWKIQRNARVRQAWPRTPNRRPTRRGRAHRRTVKPPPAHPAAGGRHPPCVRHRPSQASYVQPST
ncbi:hypothetical protein FOMPIDRAFT_1122919 [Fomitopsis schrenkii]|uniref:Uncharacterized protein n=1 Tax=Fomitopsis schrenkii TaxID=2126942 RepID=S8FPL5_FOMSC|nr:hypothetical protein FOMPIDRAFT_1122919 [Fomitopsis schrenkii]